MNVNPVDSEVVCGLFLTENNCEMAGDVICQPGMIDVGVALAGVPASVRNIPRTRVGKFQQNHTLIFLNTHAVNLAAAPVMADGVRTMSGQALECYREVLKSG